MDFSSPWMWLGLFVLSQVVVFAAREPLKRMFTSAGAALGGSLRIYARWLQRVAQTRAELHRETMRAEATEQAQHRLGRELAKVGEIYGERLQQLSGAQRQLQEGADRLNKDLQAAAAVPPDPPGWVEAVERVQGIDQLGAESGKKILGELKQHAVKVDRDARKAYQSATSERHRILSKLGGPLRALRDALTQSQHSTQAAAEGAKRVDQAVARYEAILASKPETESGQRASAVVLFTVSLVITLIAAGGAFVNFQLIALPMSELVPTGARVFGVPVSSIAALVIVLMEAAAGVFLMEGLGMTELLPRVQTLSPAQRKLLVGISFTALFVLASIEASLAILREQIVAADLELKHALSGSTVAAAEDGWSKIPVIGQAVLGFVLPWILAMVALPLESLVQSGRHVVGMVVIGSAHAGGALLRALGRLVRSGCAIGASLVDVYAAIPIWIAKVINARGDRDQGRESDARQGPRAPARREREREREHGGDEEGAEPGVPARVPSDAPRERSYRTRPTGHTPQQAPGGAR